MIAALVVAWLCLAGSQPNAPIEEENGRKWQNQHKISQRLPGALCEVMPCPCWAFLAPEKQYLLQSPAKAVVAYHVPALSHDQPRGWSLSSPLLKQDTCLPATFLQIATVFLEGKWVPVLEMLLWQFKCTCFTHNWVVIYHSSYPQARVKWYQLRWHLFFQSTQLLSYRRKTYLFPTSSQLYLSPWYEIPSHQNCGTVGKILRHRLKLMPFFFF